MSELHESNGEQRQEAESETEYNSSGAEQLEEGFEESEDEEEGAEDEEGEIHESEEESEEEEGESEEDAVGNSVAVVEPGLEDINVENLTPVEVKELQFASAEHAYLFYNEYGRVNGFGIRRSKKGRNASNEIVWVKYVCNKEGFRESKYFSLPNRKRDHRNLTRCGCQAELRIRKDMNSGVWYVSRLSDDHNHDLVGKKCSSLSRSHRKMGEDDIALFKVMRKSGISTALIFRCLALLSGGIENLRYRKKQMYGFIEKQRNLLGNDLDEALNYLNGMKANDEGLFWNHDLDHDGSFRRLFWCDSGCQLDYEVFGDVLAFDATYGKNKYKLPLIIFSGVNHHRQTCVFATSIVSNETEETYVWVLQQFLAAMKGKSPLTVITDGDMAIRNDVSVVFPQAHHRLCAWHLLRNATANVKKSYFTKQFKKCMLYDLEIAEFEERWKNLVQECRLEENPWVCQLYEKKLMWSSAHIRGKFFAGLRTTSRCEGLHSVIGKYVKKGYNLSEFVEQFQRCLECLKSNEVEADFKSQYTEPVLQTELEALERFGSKVYTREIFKVFRLVLVKSSVCVLVEVRETPSAHIFILAKYGSPHIRWHVSYYPYEAEFKCSCIRMESVGIPCSHIIYVLVQLHIEELPSSLILARWTRGCKEGLVDKYGEGGRRVEAMYNMIKYNAILNSCREMCRLACCDANDLAETKQLIQQQKMKLKEKHGASFVDNNDNGNEAGLVFRRVHPTMLRPIRRWKKGPQKCSVCRQTGHNRATCEFAVEVQHDVNSATSSSSFGIGEDDQNFDADVESDVNLGSDNEE